MRPDRSRADRRRRERPGTLVRGTHGTPQSILAEPGPWAPAAPSVPHPDPLSGSTRLKLPALPAADRPDRRRIVVVGSGTRFLSGISVYTVRLAEALADAGVVHLGGHDAPAAADLPVSRARPGWAAALTDLGDRSRVPTFDGIDWWWLPSLRGAAAFLRRQRPDTLVLQWWTGTVFHSYLALVAPGPRARRAGGHRVPRGPGHGRAAAAARRAATRAWWVRAVIRLAAGFTVHSEFDRDLLARHWDLGGKPGRGAAARTVRPLPGRRRASAAGPPRGARRTSATSCSSASSGRTRASRT